MTTPLHAASVVLTRQPGLMLRRYRELDRSDVVQLLGILPVLYPNGEKWLERRLAELADDGPRCTVALLDGVLAGVAIETPKSSEVMKLSTLYVDLSMRGRGVGNSLAGYLVDRWIIEGRRQAYVTAAHTVAKDVLRCLGDFGFRTVAEVVNRYGKDRHEVILEWLHEDASPS